MTEQPTDSNLTYFGVFPSLFHLPFISNIKKLKKNDNMKFKSIKVQTCGFIFVNELNSTRGPELQMLVLKTENFKIET